MLFKLYGEEGWLFLFLCSLFPFNATLIFQALAILQTQLKEELQLQRPCPLTYL